MKQNVRKALAISGMAVIIGTAGMTHYASAKNIYRKNSTYNEKAVKQGNVPHKTKNRAIPGKVLNVGTNSLEIRKGNTNYTIELGNQVALVDKFKNNITFADIKPGHKLRIRGTMDGNSITATSVRDISLPLENSTLNDNTK